MVSTSKEGLERAYCFDYYKPENCGGTGATYAKKGTEAFLAEAALETVDCSCTGVA